MLVASVVGVMFPVYDYDILNDAYHTHTGEQLRRGMGNVRSNLPRTLPELDQDDIDDLIDAAEDACGLGNKVYPIDIKESWPQIWLETRMPLSYKLNIYFPSPADDLPFIKILSAFGDFNSSLIKSSKKTFAILSERTSQFLFDNGTITPPTKDQAVFVFRRSGAGAAAELCGIDTALVGTGTYGKSEGIIGSSPIFKNVLNDQGLNTADTFTTNVPSTGTGADAGVGSNYYITSNDADAGTTSITIYSSFDLIDPSTGRISLYTRQVSIGTQDVPGSLI